MNSSLYDSSLLTLVHKTSSNCKRAIDPPLLTLISVSDPFYGLYTVLEPLETAVGLIGSTINGTTHC